MSAGKGNHVLECSERRPIAGALCIATSSVVFNDGVGGLPKNYGYFFFYLSFSSLRGLSIPLAYFCLFCTAHTAGLWGDLKLWIYPGEDIAIPIHGSIKSIS
jgi:hypothetical protein